MAAKQTQTLPAEIGAALLSRALSSAHRSRTAQILSAGDSGHYSPRKRLHAKCIGAMRLFQNRCADPIAAQKSGQTGKCF